MHSWETGTLHYRSYGDCIPWGQFLFGGRSSLQKSWVEGKLAVSDGLPKVGKGIFKRVCLFFLAAETPQIYDSSF